MKIAMLTTWNTVCGIAQNTKFLVDALTKLGHTVNIYCQKPFDQEVSFGDNYNLFRAWEWYGRTNKVDWDAGAFASIKYADVIHVQYESFLWHESYLKNLINVAPIVMTHHSSCTGPGCPVNESMANIVHDEEFPHMMNKRVIPMGIPDTFDFVKFSDTEPVLGSFGLHRNDDEYCHRAMRRASELVSDPIHYRTHYGDAKWVPSNELCKVLQKNRLLALIYPETGAIVSSSAACMALGTGLPVICSNTRWFRHLRNYVHMVDNEEEMAHIIAYYMVEEYMFNAAQERAREAIEKRGWTKIAQQHEELYREVL